MVGEAIKLNFKLPGGRSKPCVRRCESHMTSTLAIAGDVVRAVLVFGASPHLRSRAPRLTSPQRADAEDHHIATADLITHEHMNVCRWGTE